MQSGANRSRYGAGKQHSAVTCSAG